MNDSEKTGLADSTKILVVGDDKTAASCRCISDCGYFFPRCLIYSIIAGASDTKIMPKSNQREIMLYGGEIAEEIPCRREQAHPCTLRR